MVAFKKREIQGKGYSLELISSDILYLKFDGTTKIDISDVKKIKVQALDLVDFKSFKNIVDFGSVSGILTNDAKDFIAKDPEFIRLKKCDALITNKLTTSILIGIYIKIFAPKTPTKTFTNLENALLWIDKF